MRKTDIQAGTDREGLCLFVVVVVVVFGFLTSSSTTRLYRGRAPRQSA